MNAVNSLYVQKKLRELNTGAVFSLYDYIEFCTYNEMKKLVYREIQKKNVERIIAGLYFRTAAGCTHPSIDDIAAGLARRNGCVISPSVASVMDAFGMPAESNESYVYYSSSYSHKYNIYGEEIDFVSVPERDIVSLSPVSVLVVSALRSIGYGKVTDENIEAIRKRLSDEERKKVLSECRNCTRWIYKAIEKICLLY